MRMLQYPAYTSAAAGLVISENLTELADDDIRRIAKSYQFSINTFNGADGSLWNSIIFSKQRRFHDMLMSADLPSIRSTLADPASSDIFYGFSELFNESFNLIISTPSGLSGYG